MIDTPQVDTLAFFLNNLCFTILLFAACGALLRGLTR